MPAVLDMVDLTPDSVKMVTEFKKMGYECALEYRPKQDWPKEDQPEQGAKYIFAYGNDVWTVLSASDPNVAVRKAYERVMVY